MGDGKGPVEEVAHVREDLCGSAGLVADVEAGEMVWGVAERFPAR